MRKYEGFNLEGLSFTDLRKAGYPTVQDTGAIPSISYSDQYYVGAEFEVAVVEFFLKWAGDSFLELVKLSDLVYSDNAITLKATHPLNKIVFMNDHFKEYMMQFILKGKFLYLDTDKVKAIVTRRINALKASPGLFTQAVMEYNGLIAKQTSAIEL